MGDISDRVEKAERERMRAACKTLVRAGQETIRAYWLVELRELIGRVRKANTDAHGGISDLAIEDVLLVFEARLESAP